MNDLIPPDRCASDAAVDLPSLSSETGERELGAQGKALGHRREFGSCGCCWRGMRVWRDRRTAPIGAGDGLPAIEGARVSHSGVIERAPPLLLLPKEAAEVRSAVASGPRPRRQSRGTLAPRDGARAAGSAGGHRLPRQRPACGQYGAAPEFRALRGSGSVRRDARGAAGAGLAHAAFCDARRELILS